MNADELRAARETLGLSPVDFAVRYDLTPQIVDTLERGRARVPKRVARLVAWDAALARREAVMAASGLAECEVMQALERRIEAAQGDAKAVERAATAMGSHEERCALCLERERYADEHAGPLPEAPTPGWIRALGAVEGLLGRLPAWAWPPADDPRQGRRMGVYGALALSLIPIGVAAVRLLSAIGSGGLEADAWQGTLRIALGVPVAYLVGFYLAGAAFDATHGIRHLVVGYVARGAATAVGVYGAIGVMMPIVDPAKGDVPLGGFILFVAAAGAVVGAAWWVKDRLRGTVAAPAGTEVVDEAAVLAEPLAAAPARKRSWLPWAWAGLMLLSIGLRRWSKAEAADPVLETSYEATTKGEHARAIASLTRAAAEKPTDMEIRSQLAWAYATAGRHDEALATADSVIRVDPDRAQPHYLRGWVLLRRDRPDESIAALRRARSLDETRADIAAELSMALSAAAMRTADMATLTEALTLADFAVAREDTVAWHHAQRAQVLSFLERQDEALVSQRTAASLAPDDAEIRYRLGYLLQKSGKFDDALREWEAAERISPPQEAGMAEWLQQCRAAAKERRPC